MNVVDAEPVARKTIRDLNIQQSPTVDPNTTIRDSVAVMNQNKISEIVVVDNGKILGVVSSNALNKKIIAGNVQVHDSVNKVMAKKVKIHNLDTSLAFLAVWLEDLDYAIVQDGDFIGIVYPIHLSNFLLN